MSRGWELRNSGLDNESKAGEAGGEGVEDRGPRGVRCSDDAGRGRPRQESLAV